MTTIHMTYLDAMVKLKNLLKQRHLLHEKIQVTKEEELLTLLKIKIEAIDLEMKRMTGREDIHTIEIMVKEHFYYETNKEI